MKIRLSLLFLLITNVHLVISQTTVCDGGTEILTTIDEDITIFENCDKNLEIRPSGENIDIAYFWVYNPRNSIRLIPTGDNNIRILPPETRILGPFYPVRSRTYLGSPKRNTDGVLILINEGEVINSNQSSNNEALDKNEVQSSFFKIFPNPTKNTLNFTASAKIQTYTVFNSLGIAMLKDNVDALDHTISVSALPKGLYFIRLQTATKTITKTFLKN